MPPYPINRTSLDPLPVQGCGTVSRPLCVKVFEQRAMLYLAMCACSDFAVQSCEVHIVWIHKWPTYAGQLYPRVCNYLECVPYIV